jgi:hypothetical protein
MDYLKLLSTVSVLALSANTAFAADSYQAIFSRCFFVYAPIFQTARKLENAPVFIYAQKRFAFMMGYMQDKKDNPQFDKAFKQNHEANKQAGIVIENRLTQAIRLADVSEYVAVMNISKECDRQLGLPTNDIPPP